MSQENTGSDEVQISLGGIPKDTIVPSSELLWERIVAFGDEGSVGLQHWGRKFVTRPPYREVAFEEFPEVGDLIAVWAGRGFQASSTVPFWVFRGPINGWEEDYRDEVRQSCLVKCRLATILEQNQREACLGVEVLEVISLDQMVVRLPQSVEGSFEELDSEGSPFLNRPRVARWGDFLWIGWDAESDFGEWYLCRFVSGVLTVLLNGVWDLYAGWVYAGNRPLTPMEADMFIKTADLAG